MSNNDILQEEKGEGIEAEDKDSLAEEGEGGDQKEKSLKEIEAKLLNKEKEAKDNYDKWVRARADFENYKKRMAREKADLLMFGNERLLKELLPVIDSLERGIENAAEDAGNPPPNSAALAEGMKIILKQFFEVLEKFGLKSISSVREKFDPSKHEAVSRIESEEHEEDTIISELQKGYFLNDRLLRPTMAVVAKPSQTAEENSSGIKEDAIETDG